MPVTVAAAGLRASERPLAEAYDTVLLDLDGVVYVGPDLVPGAGEAIGALRAQGRRVGFVTNNAARPPQAVAGQLSRLGIQTDAADVVTSAQAGASLLAARLPAGARVLVVGGEGLVAALTEAGLRPVPSAEDEPAAVVSGFAPEVGWRLLAEGAFAVRRGLLWVATNLDRTVPTPRGPAPGNGTLVEVIASATGRRPDLVAGKPDPALLVEACRRTGAGRALFVGDRLDTDVAGARRAGLDSLLVLTGVSDPVSLLRAAPEQRPDYVAADLGGLLGEHPQVVVDDGGWRCEGWSVRLLRGHLAVTGHGRWDDGLRALCAAAWSLDSPPSEDAARAAVAAVGWGKAGLAGGVHQAARPGGRGLSEG